MEANHREIEGVIRGGGGNEGGVWFCPWFRVSARVHLCGDDVAMPFKGPAGALGVDFGEGGGKGVGEIKSRACG